MSSNYWEVAVSINPVCADVVCDIFDSNFECEGIVTAEEEYKDKELIKSTHDVVKAYVVAETIDLDEVRTLFALKKHEMIDKEIFDCEIGSWDVSITKQEIVDWSKKWKEHWKPSHISENIVICPTWEEYIPETDEIVVNIDPGNAFGTGTHATTQLCAMAIEKYMPKDANVADIGCGSGILAICAIKYGAKTALAIDNDPTAVETSKENAQINNVADVIEFYTQTIDEVQGKEFDFVMANILHNVLADIMSDLKRIMKKGSKVVLSGILKSKEPVVIEAMTSNNLKVVEQIEKNDWIAFVAQKED